MSNPYFRFKRFTVWHDRCAMKVGTDGALLGAWVDPGACRRVLDVGTGTGLIALMIAQRCPEAVVDAVEVDSDACGQATYNVALSPFSQQIHVHHATFREFAEKVEQPYDLIVSNPPYFVQSLKCPDAKRSIARHSDELTLPALLATSSRILAEDGRIALILPFLQKDDILCLAEQRRLNCIRQTHVIPVEGARPKRLLIELSRQPKPPVVDRLVLENAIHQRTDDYKALTKNFYLLT